MDDSSICDEAHQLENLLRWSDPNAWYTDRKVSQELNGLQRVGKPKFLYRGSIVCTDHSDFGKLKTNYRNIKTMFHFNLLP